MTDKYGTLGCGTVTIIRPLVVKPLLLVLDDAHHENSRLGANFECDVSVAKLRWTLGVLSGNRSILACSLF